MSLWLDSGIWPIDYRFVNFVEQRWDKRCIVQSTEKLQTKISHSGVQNIPNCNQSHQFSDELKTPLYLITKSETENLLGQKKVDKWNVSIN